MNKKLRVKIALYVLCSWVNTPVAWSLKMAALPHGNAALDTKASIFEPNNYFVSDDLLFLQRKDGHLAITSGLVYQEDPGEERELDILETLDLDFDKNNTEEESLVNHMVPYRGNEETKFKEKDLIYPVSDLRFGPTNMAVWLGKTVDKVLANGHLKDSPMQIKVYSQCKDMLNAFYDPTENIICIGHLYKTLGRNSLEGKNSLALDADVLVHELGHGILQHLGKNSEQVYFSFGSDIYGAMNEGQADFFSYVVTGTTQLAPWMIQVMKEYYRLKMPQIYPKVKDRQSLRVINNQYNLQKDYFGEVHDDGRIFAGALYDLAVAIGDDVAFTLWTETLTRLQEGHNYFDHVQIIQDVDREIYQEAHKFEIQSVFQKRGLLGNYSINKVPLSVESLVVDDTTVLTRVLKSFALNPIKIAQMLENNNSNGVLEKDECASIELKFISHSENDLIGVEMFVPPTSLPAGLKNLGQNRYFLGNIKSGAIVPQRAEVDNKSRPWLLVCATEDMDAAKLTVVLRATSEGVKKVQVWVNTPEEGLVERN